ncbi:hypothetical protein BH20ACT13_BH20ACT13_05950 [soil metagenome]
MPRRKPIGSPYKPGRWQILMAARRLAIGSEVGALNSKDVASHSASLNTTLWDDGKALALFKQAVTTVDGAVGGNWKRDHMRNQPTTQDVLRSLGT